MTTLNPAQFIEQLKNLPAEIKSYPQWVTWRLEEREDTIKPTKVPYCPRTGKKASPTDAKDWDSFENALAAYNTGHYSGVGFVMTDKDPFAFIDLDDTADIEDAEHRAKVMASQQQIYERFPSYAEVSPSGKGLHIIVKGSLPMGKRVGKLELYSTERFMTMTGNRFGTATTITDQHEGLNALYQEMAKTAKPEQFYKGEVEASESDAKIIERASNAANGVKFLDLYEGRWDLHYDSQSEADFALVNILAFYSDSAAQIKTIFRASALGRREKAQRDRYVQYMLNRCFDNRLPPVDLSGLSRQIEEFKAAAAAAALTASNALNTPQPVNQLVPNLAPVVQNSVYAYPPGLVGDMAQYIYDSAARQNPEIALVGALGLMAAITGRAYNVSGTGLNHYFVITAKSGVGKDALLGGTGRLIDAVAVTNPAARTFLGPDARSAEGLSKYFVKSKSFSCLIDEFGDELALMGGPKAPTHKAAFKSMLLKAYMWSGHNVRVPEAVYSDTAKNVGELLAPALSLTGISTPESMYKALSEGMLTDGLISRFTMVNTPRERQYHNPNAVHVFPSVQLVERLADLCANAVSLNSQNAVVHVALCPQAAKMAVEYDKWSTDEMNRMDGRPTNNLWSRVHLRALKLAALLAVGDNPYNPVISVDQLSWAIAFVNEGATHLGQKFDQGEIGVGSEEHLQINEVARIIREYVMLPYDKVAKYVTQDTGQMLHSQNVVPMGYISRRLVAVAVFRLDKVGATNAIKRALTTMTERGDLMLLPKVAMIRDYNTNATCYGILSPEGIGMTKP